MSAAWGRPEVVIGHDQYTMKRDYYGMALLEWRKQHPYMRRESDMSNADREWIINRARELENQ